MKDKTPLDAEEHITSPVSTPPLPDYLTVRDLQAHLKISRDTVYRLLSRGEIAFVRTGQRSVRVRREAFEQWCEEQEVSNLARAREKVLAGENRQ